MRPVAAALAIAAGTFLLMTGHAEADTTGSIVTDRSGADIAVGSGHREPGGGGSRDQPVCTFRPLNISDDRVVYDIDGTPIVVDGTGQWYEKWCGTVFHGAIYISRVNPRDLIAEARDRLDLPLPTAGLSPAGEQLVNLDTWLWVDPAQWQTLSASASVPGITVTVFATPEMALWSMGDGRVVECGAGSPYDPTRPTRDQAPSCSHVYGRSSVGRPAGAYSASLTVRWRLTWTVDGGATNLLATIDRTNAFSVSVAEVQAVNVESRGSS